jgi:predicted glycosyltransferase
MSGKVLIWCVHLLGIGHLRRAATLAQALQRSGLDVTLVSGGEHVPNLDAAPARFIELEPVRAVDRLFKILVDRNGVVIDEAFKSARRDALLSLVDKIRPDLILTEMFPFGRRQLRFEMMPLLEAMQARARRPAIISSVRDILVTSPKPERIEEMVELLQRYYDAVLIHGDAGLIPFESTFPPAARVADKLRYTGYIVDASTPQRGPGAGEVIVSAGGGAVSEPLLEAAIAAKKLTTLAGRTWRLLVGHNLPEERFQALRAAADGGMIVERARKDFVTLLANSHLSISQGGYNTVMETLQFARHSVIVPYAGGLETEQTLRAKLLAERGLCVVVEEQVLTPQRLAEAVSQALALPPIAAGHKFKLDGLNESVRIVHGLLAARR